MAAEHQQFMLSQEQMQRLLNATKPVPYMVFGGVPPMSSQESANRAWQTLAEEMGFVWDTAKPVRGLSAYYFTAEPKATKEQADA